MQERILCAAIWFDNGKSYPQQPVSTGIVLCGYRHYIILNQIYEIIGIIYKSTYKSKQGFLTSTGRFVDRIEAKQIAKAANQLVREYGDAELYSEDLY